MIFNYYESTPFGTLFHLEASVQQLIIGNKQIFHDTFFSINANENMQLTGDSGAGKTMLMLVIFSAIDLSSEKNNYVKYSFRNGPIITDFKYNSISSVGSSQIFYIPQNEEIHEITVFQFLSNRFLLSEKYKTESKKNEFFFYFKYFKELLGVHFVNVNTLWSRISGGQKRRVAFSAYLAHCVVNPISIIILDELKGLDRSNREIIYNIIFNEMRSIKLKRQEKIWIEAINKCKKSRKKTFSKSFEVFKQSFSFSVILINHMSADLINCKYNNLIKKRLTKFKKIEDVVPFLSSEKEDLLLIVEKRLSDKIKEIDYIIQNMSVLSNNINKIQLMFYKKNKDYLLSLFNLLKQQIHVTESMYQFLELDTLQYLYWELPGLGLDIKSYKEKKNV